MASLAVASAAGAQTPSRGELLGIAREVVEGAAFVSLATLDDEGYPAVRAMDPLPPDEDWVVWLATNPGSRKVEQLRARPRVALHYLAERVPAYVTLIGRARLVDDAEMKARHWKESWTPFYPDRDESVLLIEVTPIRLEVVSEAHGAPGDPQTWRAHVVEPQPSANSRPSGLFPRQQIGWQPLSLGDYIRWCSTEPDLRPFPQASPKALTRQWTLTVHLVKSRAEANRVIDARAALGMPGADHCTRPLDGTRATA